jgi:hypothetical protein
MNLETKSKIDPSQLDQNLEQESPALRQAQVLIKKGWKAEFDPLAGFFADKPVTTFTNSNTGKFLIYLSLEEIKILKKLIDIIELEKLNSVSE